MEGQYTRLIESGRDLVTYKTLRVGSASNTSDYEHPTPPHAHDGRSP